MSWEKVKLGDLYEVHNGLSKGGKFFGSGYPFLSFSTVFNNWFIPQNIKDLVQSTDKEQESYSIKKGDVFITRTSETADELGMSCVALKDYPQATYNGFCKRLRPIKSSYEVNPRYIGYYLRTSDFRGKFLGLSGTMTTRASLRNEDLLAMEILLPPIKEQKRIADILSAYDNLIENNQKQIKLLEEAAQRLYKQWFIDLRYPGHETTKIVNGLPEGWKKEKFGDIVDYIRGTSYTSSELSDGEGVLLVNLKNINAFGGYKRNAEKRFTGKYKENGILESGDLVMGCTDMTKERRLVGHVALIPNLKERAVFTMDLLKILPKTISKTFLYAQCRFGGLSYKISPLANGANVLHLRPENMADIEVLCPAKSIVEMYDNVFASMISKIEKLEDQIQLAAESRNRLLPKLMNGELEV